MCLEKVEPMVQVGSVQRRRLVAATAMLAASAAVVGTAAQGATFGGDGVGDSYFPSYGNAGYDVQAYDVAVDVDPVKSFITGDTTVTAVATEKLDVFHLDFLLKVQSVEVNGVAAEFSTEGDQELVVTPSEPVAAGEEFSVRVRYADDPTLRKPQGWSAVGKMGDGGMLILGEPESAAWWFPSNDHPTDKATFKVSVSSPSEFTGVSVGRLLSSKLEGKKRTMTWSQSRPMATYLSFLSVGKHDVSTGFSHTGHRSHFAFAKEGVNEEWGARAQEDIMRTAEVVAWQQSMLGDYPFNEIGGVLPAGKFGFALETQTRPVYSPRFWRKGHNMNVVVHEMAHQWFGNSVSVKDWRHIWLNEAFATWFGWKWAEDKEAKPVAENWERVYRKLADREDWWQVKPGNPGPSKVFHGAVYYRGAMSVEALRNKIGQENFSTLLRRWVTEKKDSNASVDEFKALAEEVSGQDLTDFFNVWLYTEGRPAPTVENGFPEGAESWLEPVEGEARSVMEEFTADELEQLENGLHKVPGMPK